MTSKSDNSIHKVCIASIKRSTIKPYDFKWTKFYETNEQYFHSNPSLPLELLENELIICSMIIDNNHYSILTTKRLFTTENGIVKCCNITTASDKLYGDFKGYNKREWTFGKISIANGEDFNYYIETGAASMIMIYGVRTIIGLNCQTQDEVDKTIKRWTNRKLID